MKTIYTPGPWETDDQCCMVFIPHRDAEGNRYAVACATEELRPTAGFFSAFDETEAQRGEAHANMLLVASAPAMRAAIERVLSTYAEKDFNYFKDEHPGNVASEISVGEVLALRESLNPKP